MSEREARQQAKRFVDRYTFELVWDFEGWEEKRVLLVDALTAAIQADSSELDRSLRAMGFDRGSDACPRCVGVGTIRSDHDGLVDRCFECEGRGVAPPKGEW